MEEENIDLKHKLKLKRVELESECRLGVGAEVGDYFADSTFPLTMRSLAEYPSKTYAPITDNQVMQNKSWHI